MTEQKFKLTTNHYHTVSTASHISMSPLNTLEIGELTSLTQTYDIENDLGANDTNIKLGFTSEDDSVEVQIAIFTFVTVFGEGKSDTWWHQATNSANSDAGGLAIPFVHSVGNIKIVATPTLNGVRDSSVSVMLTTIN